MIIWLTGLSASGKTTLGRHIWEIWKPRAPNTVIVDGEDVRDILGHRTGEDDYSLDGRRAVAERICGICAWLDSQDINAICSTISSFEDLRARNRSTLSRYFEVFVSVPLEVAFRRDGKNLYAPALRGERKNVVGMDLEFTPPISPDLVIDNSRDREDLRPLAADALATALES